MFTYNHLVLLARVVLFIGGAAALTLMLGPWAGLEHVFGLTDKAAHAIAFGALVAVSFIAFPRMRRNDLAIAAVMIGGCIEVAQMASIYRAASTSDLLADSLGVAVVWLCSQIEGLRSMARTNGYASIADEPKRNRRRSRRSRSAVAPNADVRRRHAAARASSTP
jgi:hypothetical protein